MKYCNETVSQEDAFELFDYHYCEECKFCEGCRRQLCSSDPNEVLFVPLKYYDEVYCSVCFSNNKEQK